MRNILLISASLLLASPVSSSDLASSNDEAIMKEDLRGKYICKKMTNAEFEEFFQTIQNKKKTSSPPLDGKRIADDEFDW